MRPTSNVCFLRKKLPYDSEVEFIKSTGTQYIKTGIPFDSKQLEFSLKMDFENNLTGWSDEFMGAFVSDSSDSTGVRMRIYGDNSGEIDCSFMNSPRLSPGLGNHAKVRNNGTTTTTLKQGECVVRKGTTVLARKTSGNASGTPCGLEIYLFAGNQNNNAFRISTGMMLKTFTIKKGDVLVQDLIAVRVGTEGCMYDKVTGTLLHNAGTGDFILGDDKN